MMKLLLPILCIAALFISSCLTNTEQSPTQPVDASSPLGRKFEIGKYSVSNGKLTAPKQFDTHFYCDGNTSLFRIDYSFLDSIYFELKKDSLILGFQAPRTFNSGALVQDLQILIRVSGDTTLEGIWQFKSLSYRILSGTLSGIEKRSLEEMVVANKAIDSLQTVSYQFKNEFLNIFLDRNYSGWFIANWNGLHSPYTANIDSSKYNISLKKISKNICELNGLTSGEIVQLNFENDSIEIFTSSNPAHKDFEVNFKARTCPNPFIPDWYTDFLNSNLKATAFNLN